MTAAGSSQDAASDREDVRQAYRLLLGREPEGEAVYAARTGASRRDLLRSVMQSGEFGVRVMDSVARHLRPSGGTFDGAPDAALRDWIVRRLPLLPFASDAVAAATDWTRLCCMIFTDAAFRHAVSEGTDAETPAFLDRLRLLDVRNLQVPRACLDPLPPGTRLLVTGAEGSGAEFLRAMLDGHPDVAIRDGSDPTRLVDGIGDEGSDGAKPHRLVCDVLPIDAFDEDLCRRIENRSAFGICIVLRNPYDAVRQALDRDTGATRPVQRPITRWIEAWSRTVVLAARHPDIVRIVRFEDLCDDPSAVMADLHAWLGLTPHDPGELPRGPRAPPCSSHDARVVETLLGPVLDRWNGTPTGTLIREHHALCVPSVPGDRVACSSDEAARVLTHGFSFREDWGRWTDGPRAVITVRHGETTGLLLVELWVARSFAAPGEACDVIVTAGWSEPKLFTVTDAPTRLALAMSAAETAQPGLLEIEILVARPKMPDQPPADGRALGIGLEAFRVTRLPGRDQ